MDRRGFVAGTLALVAAPLGTDAQPVTKTARIGLLGLAPTPTPNRPLPTSLNSFVEGLRERGWVEGQNVVFEFREGPDLQANATELVRLKVDVIVTMSGPPTAAAKAATQTIPIVFAATDPVGRGFIASLARPGGNLTGLDQNETGLYSKRVQLLKEVIPRIRRVAFLVDPDYPVARRAV